MNESFYFSTTRNGALESADSLYDVFHVASRQLEETSNDTLFDASSVFSETLYDPSSAFNDTLFDVSSTFNKTLLDAYSVFNETLLDASSAFNESLFEGLNSSLGCDRVRYERLKINFVVECQEILGLLHCVFKGTVSREKLLNCGLGENDWTLSIDLTRVLHFSDQLCWTAEVNNSFTIV